MKLSSFEAATEVAKPIIPNNERRRTLRASDGNFYIGKNSYCKKTRSNTNWLVNEIIAFEYAKASQVRVPEIKLLRCNDVVYLGSHFVPNRLSLKKGEVANRCIASDIPHLMRALLLDLALLNSDRTAENTLCDGYGFLWFYDYDKALWGDGRELEAQPAGDLYRLDPSILDGKLEAYISDFLGFSEANAIAFAQERDNQLLEAFNSLQLTLEPLHLSVSKTPIEWMNADLFKRLESFLPQWWKKLQSFFSDSNAPSRIRTILRNRSQFGGQSC